MSGVYTTDTSGEFYTLEFEEFRRIIDLVTEVTKPLGMPVHIGCTWTDTRGVLRRAEYAVGKGAIAIKFTFPFWLKLTLTEALRFIEDLAGVCGEIPLIHYNSSYSKLVFGIPEYQAAVSRVPTLKGAKITSQDPIVIAGLIENVPELQFLRVNMILPRLWPQAASGMYSWLAATNPRLCMEWYHSCLQGEWNRAMVIQKIVNRWKVEVKLKWSCKSDAAVNKLDAALNPNFHCGTLFRPPYFSGTDEDLKLARHWVAQYIPEMLLK